MNKIILLAFVVGTALAQYPSPSYNQGGRSDVSAAYSQRGGQYAEGGAGNYGSRNAGPAGYSASSSGSYSGSNSAAVYSNSYKSSVGAGPAAYAGAASRGYSGASQGAYNGPARAGYNAGGNYNGAAAYSSYNAQDDLSEPAKYEFKYDVLAPEFYNEFGHSEQRDGDYTSGTYYVLLPDGRRQVVEYTADQDGYKPKISYTEPNGNPGQYSRSGPYNGQPGQYNSPSGPYNGQPGQYNSPSGPYNGQPGQYNSPSGPYNPQAGVSYNAGQGAAYNAQALQRAGAAYNRPAQSRTAGYKAQSYQQPAPSAGGY